MFAASLLDDLHKPNSVKKKLANLHVVSLGKILDEMPLFLCGTQVMESTVK